MDKAPCNAMGSVRRAGAIGLSALAVMFLAGCMTAKEAQKDYDAQVSEVVLATAVDAERSYDYKNAVRHFSTLYEGDKTNPYIIRDLARNLRYSGAPKQAVYLLKRSIKSLGNRPDFTLELAKAQLAASELADAHETLIAARESKALVDNWQYHLVFGIYYDRSGKYPQAQESYIRALGLSPNNVAVLNNLALSYALSGNIDKGIKTLQKLADSENTTSHTRQNLALLYGVKGDMAAAGRLVKQDLPKDVTANNLRTYRSFHE